MCRELRMHRLHFGFLVLRAFRAKHFGVRWRPSHRFGRAVEVRRRAACDACNGVVIATVPRTPKAVARSPPHSKASRNVPRVVQVTAGAHADEIRTRALRTPP